MIEKGAFRLHMAAYILNLRYFNSVKHVARPLVEEGGLKFVQAISPWHSVAPVPSSGCARSGTNLDTD